MDIGKFNRRVAIQQKTTVYDELHQPIGEDWADLATVWADIRHLSGVETIRGDADVSIVRASIRTRYLSGATAGMRIAQGATIYDIGAVLQDEQGRRFTDFICTTGANQG